MQGQAPFTAYQARFNFFAHRRTANVQSHEDELKAIERQGQRLTKLVGDLLDVARISAGTLELDLAEVDLSDLARSSAARLEPDLAHSGSSLELETSSRIVGRWDGSRLEQVLVNLLSNAIRYGTGRPIVFSTELLGNSARVTVKDNGVGIEPERLVMIFDRFQRSAGHRTYGGLGLGLYISRQIVERLGGTIRATSHLGVGSTFTVDLPLAGPRGF